MPSSKFSFGISLQHGVSFIRSVHILPGSHVIGSTSQPVATRKQFILAKVKDSLLGVKKLKKQNQNKNTRKSLFFISIINNVVVLLYFG